MEHVTVSSSVAGANTVSFSLAEDRFVTAAIASAQLVVSNDPSATYASVITSPTTGTDTVTLFLFPSGLWQSGIKVPILGGRTYYVAFKAAGAIIFYLESV